MQWAVKLAPYLTGKACSLLDGQGSAGLCSHEG